MKYSDKLKQRYYDELQVELAHVLRDFKPDIIYIYDGSGIIGRTYVGGQLCMWPSGKIYAPWTTNQTARDMIKDEAFSEAIELLTEEHGLCYMVEGGDVFICSYDGDARDSYISFDCGETFEYNGDTFTEDEVRDNMEREGHWPNVYRGDQYGELTYYVIE